MDTTVILNPGGEHTYQGCSGSVSDGELWIIDEGEDIVETFPPGVWSSFTVTVSRD